MDILHSFKAEMVFIANINWQMNLCDLFYPQIFKCTLQYKQNIVQQISRTFSICITELYTH